MSTPRMLQSLLSRLITPVVRHALVEADREKPGYGPPATRTVTLGTRTITLGARIITLG